MTDQATTEDLSCAPAQKKAHWTKRLIKLGWRLGKWSLLSTALFGLLILVGLIPVNNDFRPAADGIEIMVVSNPVHADIVLPVVSSVIDWRDHFPPEAFRGDTAGATHVAIGWGDKGFFIETPTWNDLKVSTAAHALFWPSGTCLHVVMLESPNFTDGRSVKISDQQYRQLTEFILASFQKNQQGEKVQIVGESYSDNDAFYEALGTYHLLNTCNSWVGRALRTAGVRCGWLTPMPKTIYLFLPQAD